VISLIEQLKPFAPQIIAFILTSSGAIAKYYFKPKVSLRYGQRALFVQRVNTVETESDTKKQYDINSQSVTIQNKGWFSAENVEIILANEPDGFSIWPQRHYSIEINPSGTYVIKIPSIAPKENFFIDYTTMNRNLHNFLALRNKESVGGESIYIQQEKFPSWMIYLLWAFAFLGLYQMLVWIIRWIF
jgi:hypothetical protein